MKITGLTLAPLAVLAAALFGAGAFVRLHAAPSSTPKGVLWASLSHPFSPTESGTGMEPRAVFESVLHSLQSDYVDKITDEKKLTYGAIDAMVAALDDPYSQFLTPERLKAVDDAQRQGIFHGLGAFILPQRTKHKDLTYERLVVADVLPGSPAEKAGLLSGDILTQVDGKYFFQIPDDVLAEDIDPTSARDLFPEPKGDEELTFISYKEALGTLSADGKTVPLMVQHVGAAKPVPVTVALGPTHVPPATSRMASPGVGYIAVRGFTVGSHDEIAKEISGLESQGARSLVVDLRNSYGGPLSEVKQVAGMLVKGSLGYIVHQKGNRDTITLPTEAVFPGKVVVMVNGGTLGTSELLASALEEESKAPVVGTTTFGDGLDQTLIPLDDGSAIELTTGKFLTSSGVAFHLKGITPTQTDAGSPEHQLASALALAKAPGGAGV